MKIHVRRRHIEKGKAGKSSKCPIALACRECLGGRGGIAVLYFSLRAGCDYYTLPRTATRFISRFDSGKPVKPFAFTIRA
jgi:hypothetical protein